MPTASPDPILTLGAQSFMLVSLWKPILLMAPFVAWCWIISNNFDKHAKRFYLGVERWNAIHMIFATAALALIFFFPVGGILGFIGAFFASVIILSADLLIFISVTNKNEKVPESARITLNISEMSKAREERKAAKQLGSSELTITGANKSTVPPPPKDTPELAVRIAAEQVVVQGFEAHASQIDIVPTGESAYAVSMLIDGVRQAGESLPASDAIKVIDFWKSCAGLDTSDRRRKLTGFVAISGSKISDADLKLTTSGTKAGMKMTIIFDPSKAVRRDPKDLGLLDQQMKLVNSWVNDDDQSGGLVLVGIPSDNGRTTTGYSLLKLHDAYTSNIQTLEYEVEDELEGVKQVVWNNASDEADFATSVRSILRRDPDVVYVSDLPDAKTAANVANADLERTRVYLSIPSEDPMTVIQTYIKNAGDAKLAAKGLRGIIVCKLVRVLCGNCKVPYQPSGDMLKKLGLPEGKVSELYKKGGQVLVRNKPEVCSVCNGIGYQGQTGCYAVYPINDEERDMIIEGNSGGLRSALRKKGLPSIQQSALRKAVQGITSIEEVTRITAPRKSSSSSSKKPTQTAKGAS
jgi:type IV pilus assembly protein PilB